MKIVIALDSFKSSMSSEKANRIIYQELSKRLPDAIFEVIQVSDGGEGLVNSLTNKVIETPVIGPLGKTINSFYGMINDKTAVIEMAAASGIEILTDNEINASRTTSYGVGELIIKVLDLDVDTIIIGLGGSATNDLGIGMLSALGMKFYDKNHNILKGYGSDLIKVSEINSDGLDQRLKNVQIVIAADVNNVLYGKNGATKVYGKQKGLNYLTRIRYDKHIKRVSKLMAEHKKIDKSHKKGAGAAGGLGFSLLTFTNSKIISGFELLSEKVNITEKLKNADIVITGEGKIDNQTLNGKAPYKIATLAKAISTNSKVVAFCGLKGKTNKLFMIDEIININDNDPNHEKWIINGETNLKNTIIKWLEESNF